MNVSGSLLYLVRCFHKWEVVLFGIVSPLAWVVWTHVNTVITLWSHKTTEPRSPRQCSLSWILIKAWSGLFAVRTQPSRLSEQIASVCFAWQQPPIGCLSKLAIWSLTFMYCLCTVTVQQSVLSGFIFKCVYLPKCRRGFSPPCCTNLSHVSTHCCCCCCCHDVVPQWNAWPA